MQSDNYDKKRCNYEMCIRNYDKVVIVNKVEMMRNKVTIMQIKL